MANNALIIQHVYNLLDPFVDMARLTYQRHAAYANSHKMDYWHFIGDRITNISIWRGGWAKVQLIQKALEAGYDHVFWIDADAAINNFDCDLRDALPEGAAIGAVLHDPAKSPWLQQNKVDAHLNVGVLYAKAAAKPIIDEWLSRYDGPLGRFLEQGVFNDMVNEGRWSISRVDDGWNATVQVNMVDNPNVIGWHGIAPVARRLAMMQAFLKDDWYKFRI